MEFAIQELALERAVSRHLAFEGAAERAQSDGRTRAERRCNNCPKRRSNAPNPDNLRRRPKGETPGGIDIGLGVYGVEGKSLGNAQFNLARPTLCRTQSRKLSALRIVPRIANRLSKGVKKEPEPIAGSAEPVAAVLRERSIGEALEELRRFDEGRDEQRMTPRPPGRRLHRVETPIDF